MLNFKNHDLLYVYILPSNRTTQNNAIQCLHLHIKINIVKDREQGKLQQLAIRHVRSLLKHSG